MSFTSESRAIMVSTGSVDSSVSARMRSVGIAESVSGLNFSPKEMWQPERIRAMAAAGFPLNPCMHQGCVGFMSRRRPHMISSAFTSWIINGLRSFSEISTCLRNTSSCRNIGAREAGLFRIRRLRRHWVAPQSPPVWQTVRHLPYPACPMDAFRQNKAGRSSFLKSRRCRGVMLLILSLQAGDKGDAYECR